MPVVEDIRVLVVDDMEENLQIELSLLHTFDLHADGTRYAEDVLRMIDERRPSVVLTDINLRNKPGDKSGVEVARAVRAAYPDLPIVGYSSSVFDLGTSERAVFVEIISRGDDDPAKLVAASIRHSSETLIPRAKYPIVGLDVMAIPQERFTEPTINASTAAPRALASGWTTTDDGNGVPDDDETVKLVLSPNGFNAHLGEPIAVQASMHRRSVEVFVTEHAELCGAGDTLDIAAGNLIAAMRWFWEDLRDDPEDELGESALRLRSFLRATYVEDPNVF